MKLRFKQSMLLADVEREHILHVLHIFGFNRSETAKCLGIGIRTLYRKLKEYGYTDEKHSRAVARGLRMAKGRQRHGR